MTRIERWQRELIDRTIEQTPDGWRAKRLVIRTPRYPRLLRTLLAILSGEGEPIMDEKQGPQTIEEQMREALIWMSGSEDFAPGGKAREGFEKIVLPLLKR